MISRTRSSGEDLDLGAREPFEDAALYDWEYRRRRADVAFYRTLVEERMAAGPQTPVLDLACGTGRLTMPLLRAGLAVVGVDRSAPMLDRAASRVARLSVTRRKRCLLVRADLRNLPLAGRFSVAIAAFHSVQHLYRTADLLNFFRRVRQSLVPGGWFAFDILPPNAAWLARDSERRWARTTFRHPETGQRHVYTTNHVYDRKNKVLRMRLYYQPVDNFDRPSGAERVLRLHHRQLRVDEVTTLLAAAGLEIIARYAGFDFAAHNGNVAVDDDSDENIYVARPT